MVCLTLQGRQKLARFNAREFATLIIDILNDAKRRQTGVMSPVQTPKEPGREILDCNGSLVITSKVFTLVGRVIVLYL